MKKHKLHTQLAAGFACIVFVMIFLISLSANVLIRSRFEKYIESEQERFSEQLTENLANQYTFDSDTWNLEYIHGVGMYAVNDGYFLKLRDSEGNLIWDLELYDMECCKNMMVHINETMAMLKSSDGEFVSHEYPMYRNGQLIGYTEVAYYTSYYMNENAFSFIDSLNQILAVIGIISLIGAVAAGVLFSRRITEPISEIIKQTKFISEGNYDNTASKKVTSAEVAELTEAISSMADTLKKQDKLRRQLTGDVAHELRTPLTNVSSQLEMITEGIWQPTTERIASCYDEIRRISALVDDMEKMHQIDAGNLILNKTEFSLRTMLELVISSFEKEFADKELLCSLHCGEFSVNADRDRLIQVVTNLLSNAVKYSKKGGSITLTAQQTTDGISLSVRDNGIGISEEDLPYIFERFYRADKSRNRSTGGAGIGLAIVSSIVEAHGGIITAKSVPGKETEFIVTLP